LLITVAVEKSHATKKYVLCNHFQSNFEDVAFIIILLLKKLDSLKRFVRTTVLTKDDHHTTKTAKIKKVILLISTSPDSQCADK